MAYARGNGLMAALPFSGALNRCREQMLQAEHVNARSVARQALESSPCRAEPWRMHWP
jgi:hypothetical protein